jgi:hypothetical protein
MKWRSVLRPIVYRKARHRKRIAVKDQHLPRRIRRRFELPCIVARYGRDLPRRTSFEIP